MSRGRRITVGRLMLVIVVCAVVSLAGRILWNRWRQPRGWNPVWNSVLDPRYSSQGIQPIVTAGTVPIVVKYDFRFGGAVQPPGTVVLVFASVWVEEVTTHEPVCCYTFDAPLTMGGRERAAGEFVWDAMIPRSGTYRVHHQLYIQTPTGELDGFIGGSGGTRTIVVQPDPEPSGATP